MSKSAPRLGRGLSSLISTDYTTGAKREPKSSADTSKKPVVAETGGATSAAVNSIRPNRFQPREEFDGKALAELVKSIRQSGIIQPLVVRPADKGWELIAGERRLRAAKEAGLKEVPIVIRYAKDDELLELALVENIHREDLNAIERAKAYRRYSKEFQLSAEQIAERIGEDRSTVANYLRLLELDSEIQQLVADRALSMGHARCLLAVRDSARRLELVTLVIKDELSVRDLEGLVRRGRKDRESGAVPKPEDGRQRALVRSIQERLTEALGVRVSIKERQRPNTGRITIEYRNLNDFHRVTEALGVKVD